MTAVHPMLGSPRYKKVALKLRIIAAQYEIERCKEELLKIVRLEAAEEILSRPSGYEYTTRVMSFHDMDSRCSEAERMHRALL